MKLQWPVSFSKQEPTAPRELKAVLGTSESLGSFLMFGSNGAASPSDAINLYEKSSAVSIPINMVADAFTSIQPVIKYKEELLPAK